MEMSIEMEFHWNYGKRASYNGYQLRSMAPHFACKTVLFQSVWSLMLQSGRYSRDKTVIYLLWTLYRISRNFGVELNLANGYKIAKLKFRHLCLCFCNNNNYNR